MRIGELASRGGVTAKTIRYYESIGLLAPPERRANGYREYGAESIDRLHFIRDSQAAGLSLAETSDILRMKADGHGTCSHSRALIDRHLLEIDRQIESLLAAKGELVALSRRAEVLDPEDCNDPNACQVLRLDIPVDSKV